jgi:hypothetical protein
MVASQGLVGGPGSSVKRHPELPPLRHEEVPPAWLHASWSRLKVSFAGGGTKGGGADGSLVCDHRRVPAY